MKVWDDITTAALMGTERQTRKAVEGVDALSTALAQVDGGDAEGALLASAAIAATYRNAGERAAKSTALLPEPAAVDTLPECSAKAASLLSTAFENREYRAVVGEALDLVAKAGKRIPPVLLPDLLDLGHGNKDLREKIAGVIGRRGVWLAARNPNWSYAAAEVEVDFDETSWSIAPRETRVAALAEIGRRDPTEARRLLESTWSKESADDRAELLATRFEGLSQEDEPFLEAALDDRSSGVRHVAASLLSFLPESRYVLRMSDRLKSMVDIKYKFGTGHSLDVKLPEELDNSAIRDGVEIRQTGSGGGNRAGWLRRVVENVPPLWWVSTFDLKPEQVIDYVEKSEWFDPLLRGIISAVSRQRDDEWALALLMSPSKRVTHIPVLEFGGAIANLSQSSLETVILARLATEPFGAATRTRDILSRYPGQWPESLARPILKKIAKTLAEFSDQQTLGQVMSFISELATKVPPSLADELETSVSESATTLSTNPYWRRSVDQAVDILRFRHDLREAIMEN